MNNNFLYRWFIIFPVVAIVLLTSFYNNKNEEYDSLPHPKKEAVVNYVKEHGEIDITKDEKGKEILMDYMKSEEFKIDSEMCKRPFLTTDETSQNFSKNWMSALELYKTEVN